jgi:hypothetical protein
MKTLSLLSSRFTVALGLLATLATAACGDDDEPEPGRQGAGGSAQMGQGGSSNQGGSGGSSNQNGSGGTGGATAGNAGAGGSGAGGAGAGGSAGGTSGSDTGGASGSAGAGGSSGSSAGGASGSDTGGSSGSSTSGAGGTDTGGTSGAGGSSAGGAGGVGGSGGTGGVPKADPVWYECQGTDQAFVRRAYAAVFGHRPEAQGEVKHYADVVHAIDVLEGVDLAAPYDPAKPRASHAALVDLLLADRPGDYLSRWTEVYLDALRVQRVDELENSGCFDQTQHPNPAALVPIVRDLDAKTAQGLTSPFTMLDLVRGSLLADDVTAPYVGNLFAMLTRTYSGANADPVELELSRRSDFGAWFNASYLHRDVVCLGCHNSEFSVTQSPDPAVNRHFPVRGLFERSLFGSSFGPEPKDGYEGPTRAWGILRYDGFADGGGTRPWGWSGQCGSFNPAVGDDIAGVDAKFGPLTGKRVTAFETSRLLQQGFNELRQTGLVVDAQNNVQSPAMSFAYLVSMNIVEHAWREIVGTPLTIPVYFPRNAAARDELRRLTDAFIAGGFSQRALLKAIVTSPAFNLASADDACWAKPYPAPPLFDPWTTGEPEAGRRGNGPSDAVAPLAGRAVVRAMSSALEWPNPLPSFPQSNFQQLASAELGLFLHNAEPGFRGFDFQARLSWELSFGKCDFPGSGPTVDFIDRLIQRAAATPGATAGDLVLALKDRLLGETAVDEAIERPALEALLGAALDAPAAQVQGLKLRSLCGALIATPQMLLTGMPAPDSQVEPLLTPTALTSGRLCIGHVGDAFGPYQLGCAGGQVTVTKPPTPPTP